MHFIPEKTNLQELWLWKSCIQIILEYGHRYNISILHAADCLLRSQQFFSLSTNYPHLMNPEGYNGTVTVRCEEDRGSV